MSAPAERSYKALVAALGVVPELRSYDDPSAQLDPPAAIVSPPMLTFGGPTSDPVAAEFVVIVAVPADDRYVARLFALVPEVTAALESHTDAVVTRAMPGTWQNGATALPCYEIAVEMSLNDGP